VKCILIVLLFFIVGDFAAYGTVTCPNDFTDHTGNDILIDTFMVPVDNRCTDGAYEFVTIPDTFYPIYSGFIAGTAVPLCNDGYLSGNNCVSYTQGNCDTGNYTEGSLTASAFMAPVDNRCTDGAYEYRTNLTDLIYPIYNGFIAGDVATLCADNQYLANGNTCTNYVQDDCPNNYIDISTNDNMFVMRTGEICGTDYQDYSINQQCGNNTTDAVCAVLCSDGLQYTDVGTCATLCQAGVTTLNARYPSGDVISFPLYSTQQSTPTVAIRNNDTVCYVNLVAGSANGAINLKFNDTVYHTVR